MTATQRTDALSVVRFNIPTPPDIDAFLADAREILESGWLSGSKHVAALERELRSWTESEHVVAVTSATSGLIAALDTFGEPGGEVIIPGYTFLATWQAVAWADMTAVVADVDERGLLDPAAVLAAATPKTRVVVPVHLSGNPAAADKLAAVASRIGARLVFDAAHALGARHNDRFVGGDGDAEVFSMGATKPLGADEGGIVTARTAEAEEQLRRFAWHGGAPGNIDPYGRGLNLRVPELTAALARRCLERLDAQIDRRAEIHRRYAEAWSGLPLRLSGPLPGQRSAFKEQMVWLANQADREPLMAYLDAARIQYRLYHSIVIPDLSAFEGRVASVDRSRWLAERSICVPMHGRLTDADVDRVIEGVGSFFAHR